MAVCLSHSTQPKSKTEERDYNNWNYLVERFLVTTPKDTKSENVNMSNETSCEKRLHKQNYARLQHSILIPIFGTPRSLHGHSLLTNILTVNDAIPFKPTRGINVHLTFIATTCISNASTKELSTSQLKHRSTTLGTYFRPSNGRFKSHKLVIESYKLSREQALI